MSRWASLLFSTTGRGSETDHSGSHVDAESSSSYLSSMAKILLCADTGTVVQLKKSRGESCENPWIQLVDCVVCGDILLVYPPKEEHLFESDLRQSGNFIKDSLSTKKTLADLSAFQKQIANNFPHPMLAPMDDIVKLDEVAAARYSAYFSTCLTLGEPWCFLTQTFIGSASTLFNEERKKKQNSQCRAIRTPSFKIWFLFLYLPIAFVTYIYLLLLYYLQVISSRDWMNGGCFMAILSTPFIFTIFLALLLSDDAVSLSNIQEHPQSEEMKSTDHTVYSTPEKKKFFYLEHSILDCLKLHLARVLWCQKKKQRNSLLIRLWPHQNRQNRRDRHFWGDGLIILRNSNLFVQI